MFVLKITGGAKVGGRGNWGGSERNVFLKIREVLYLNSEEIVFLNGSHMSYVNMYVISIEGVIDSPQNDPITI